VKALPLLEDVVACCSPVTDTPLGQGEADQLASLLKVVADATRLRLLSLIASSDDGEVCVCHLTAPLGLSQPTISHHLKVLTEAGLLQRDKRGVWAYYRLAPGALAAVGALFSAPVPAR
jgi:ArsR family transcriptional regulator